LAPLSSYPSVLPYVYESARLRTCCRPRTPEASPDLILVHGLNDYRGLTWTNKFGQFCLLSIENHLPHVSQWTYEYDAHAVSDSQGDLGAYATRFLSKLQSRRLSNPFYLDVENDLVILIPDDYSVWQGQCITCLPAMNQSARYLLPRGFVNAWQLSRESLQTKLVL
jgi:hypothetical protein